MKGFWMCWCASMCFMLVLKQNINCDNAVLQVADEISYTRRMLASKINGLITQIVCVRIHDKTTNTQTKKWIMIIWNLVHVFAAISGRFLLAFIINCLIFNKNTWVLAETGIVFGLFLSLSVFFPKSQRHPVSQTPAGLWMSRYSTPFLAYTIHLHINRILWKGRWQRWNRKRGRRKEKTCT